jgi:solute carrier family 35, member E3
VLLYTVSRTRIGLFESKRVDMIRIMPLALGMIFNVVLPNASLAYSSIQFYQIMRVLVTPCVCVLNFMLLRQTIPRLAAATLVPVCIGVGVISYFDTQATAGTKPTGTSLMGVVFAFAGVFATAIYTVWIKMYHSVLDCTSMQLLFNQAPVSVLMMLYIVPFSDDITVWHSVEWPTFCLVLFVSSQYSRSEPVANLTRAAF